jgi:hypothetical protein
MLALFFMAFQALSTGVDHVERSAAGLLLEDVEDHHRIRSEAVDDPPGGILVVDAELVTAGTDDRHGP